MELSGTSFAAPVVSGWPPTCSASIPTGPDQVKGAIMRAATAIKKAVPLSVGVGEVDIHDALEDKTPPPNPNAGLNQFLVPDPDGGPYRVFDSASWLKAAQANASWNSASWVNACEHGVLEHGFLNSASWNTDSFLSAS